MALRNLEQLYNQIFCSNVQQTFWQESPSRHQRWFGIRQENATIQTRPASHRTRNGTSAIALKPLYTLYSTVITNWLYVKDY